MKRTAISLLTLLFVLVFVFIAARLTGNPAEVMYPDGLEPGQLEMYNEKYGLDESYPVQFYKFVVNTLSGDFGDSILERRPVTEIVFSRIGETIKLGAWAFGLSVLLGVSLGIFMAIKRESWLTKIIDHILAIIYAIPGFIIAIFLMLFFSFYLNLLPSLGGGTALHYIMPVISLSIGPSISIARHVRNGIIETLSQDYIRTAVAKGIGKRQSIIKHAFRNALIPTLTIIGMVVIDIITGSMVIETVFSWPGIGLTIVKSVMDRDYPIIQFTIILVSTLVVVITYVLDILYMIVDPRVGKGANS